MQRNLAEDGRRSASPSPLVGNKENAVATENSRPRYPSLSFSSPALKLNFRVSEETPISPIQINGPNYGIKTASFDSQQLAAEIVAPYPLSVTPITTHNAIPRVSLSPRYVTKNEKKKAKSKTSKKKAKAASRPAPVAKQNIELWEFEIYDILCETEKPLDGFSVILIPSMNGLHDLVSAVFKHSLGNKIEWNAASSNQWTIEYEGKEYCDHLPFLSANKFTDEINIETSKGSFSMNNGTTSFKFKLLDTGVKQIEKKGDMCAYPICAEIRNGVVFTTYDGLEHVSKEDIAKAEDFRQKYKDFFNGMNSWQILRDTKDAWMLNAEDGWIPSKPIHPDWCNSEIAIIALYKNCGMKFSQAWKTGMSFAFILRSKASTSSKWYSMQPWEIEQFRGKDLSESQRIILAKQLSLELMQSTLSFGLPEPVPRPPPVTRKRSHDEMADESVPQPQPSSQDFSHLYVPPKFR